MSVKIIEAVRHGDLSYVQVRCAGVLVTMQREGELVGITTKGRGNVRFTKSQAKLIHQMLNG